MSHLVYGILLEEIEQVKTLRTSQTWNYKAIISLPGSSLALLCPLLLSPGTFLINPSYINSCLQALFLGAQPKTSSVMEEHFWTTFSWIWIFSHYYLIYFSWNIFDI